MTEKLADERLKIDAAVDEIDAAWRAWYHTSDSRLLADERRGKLADTVYQLWPTLRNALRTPARQDEGVDGDMIERMAQAVWGEPEYRPVGWSVGIMDAARVCYLRTRPTPPAEERVQALVASHIAEIGDEPFVVLKDSDGGWMTRTLAAHEVLTRPTPPADEIETVADLISRASAIRCVEAMIEATKAQPDQGEPWPSLAGVGVAIQQIPALSAVPRNSDELREALERERERLRVLMLDQPTTGNRETYSDGFAQALACSIGRIDAALSPEGGKHG